MDLAWLWVSLGLAVCLYGLSGWPKERWLRRVSLGSSKYTGQELAHLLLTQAGLAGSVKVVRGHRNYREAGSYNPWLKQVTLGPAVSDGNDVTSVAITAHEVGHALQHKEDYWAQVIWRNPLYGCVSFVAGLALWAKVLGALLALVDFSPALALVCFLVSLPTLVVEFDANRRAADKLRGYLSVNDLEQARKILHLKSLALASTFWLGGSWLVNPLIARLPQRGDR